jgi:hypothetical protein
LPLSDFLVSLPFANYILEQVNLPLTRLPHEFTWKMCEVMKARQVPFQFSANKLTTCCTGKSRVKTGKNEEGRQGVKSTHSLAISNSG